MLVVTLILDGVGVGDAPDADAYGDAGSFTLGHVCEAARPVLPTLAEWGLGCIAEMPGVPSAETPRASWGRLTETAAGKDSTTGHWELAGVILDQPFPTYPKGFPAEVVERFCEATGATGVLGNRPESGTVIIEELGEEHQRTGRPIVYTSADSVFQIAAHTETVALEDLYRMCRIARREVMQGEHGVGRVIARPFVGAPGAYERVPSERRDFALKPPSPPLQSVLQEGGVRTVAIGKIGSLFAGVGFDSITKTADNAEGVTITRRAIQRAAESGEKTFIWTNLVDFDELYGHRNDPTGFAEALEAFDAALTSLVEALPEKARLIVTADHGNDPTYPGTDHTRERVPLLVFDPAQGQGRKIGTRGTYADHAASVAAALGAPWNGPGTSFL